MRARPERGQAAVELALVLPLVAALALLLLQVALLVRDQVLVTHAAREGAREAAATTALRSDRLSVDLSGRGGAGSHVVVAVTYRSPTDLPLVGHLLGDVELGAKATMRVESDGREGAGG